MQKGREGSRKREDPNAEARRRERVLIEMAHQPRAFRKSDLPAAVEGVVSRAIGAATVEPPPPCSTTTATA